MIVFPEGSVDSVMSLKLSDLELNLENERFRERQVPCTMECYGSTSQGGIGNVMIICLLISMMLDDDMVAWS